jgi:signal transduction histidine kinase
MADFWERPAGPWLEVLEGSKPVVVFEAVLLGREGTRLPVLASFMALSEGYVLGVVEFEGHRPDRLASQSQKLAVLGQLSGGIAHDLNNMLGILVGMADLIKSSLPAQDPLQESVDLILQTLTRASSLSEKMLDFARQTPQVKAGTST